MSITPQQKVKTASIFIFCLGGINLILGLANLLFAPDFLSNLDFGWETTVLSIVLIGLGFGVKRLSLVSSWLAMFIALTFLAKLSLSIANNYDDPGTIGYIILIFFTAAMYDVINAIKKLKPSESPDGWKPQG